MIDNMGNSRESDRYSAIVSSENYLVTFYQNNIRMSQIMYVMYELYQNVLNLYKPRYALDRLLV